MKLKICGLNNETNIQEVLLCQPDFIGFIFYDKSARNCTLSSEFVSSLNTGRTKKVGVFVNEAFEKVLKKVTEYQLDYVQLHGNEDKNYCQQLKTKGIQVIKVFLVDASFEMNQINTFQFCDYILFDTRGEKPGGNGKLFDWEILKQYKGTIPFLLSGGLELKHTNLFEEISNIHPLLIGLDINSKFEISPGLKDIDLIKEFSNELKKSNHV